VNLRRRWGGFLQKNQQIKRFLFLVLRFGLAVVLLGILYKTGRLDIGVVSKVRLTTLLSTLPLYFLSFIAGIWRWQCLVSAVNLPISLYDTTRMTMIGIWFSSVMPGGSVIGGDAARIAYLAKQCPNRRTDAAVSVMIDRAIGLMSILVIALLSVMLNEKIFLKNQWVNVIFLILFSGLSGLLVLLLVSQSEPIRQLVESLPWARKIPGSRVIFNALAAFYDYRECRSALLKGHLVSYIGHGAMIIAIMLLARDLDIHLGIKEYLFAISVGLITAMIPISGPAGVGAGNVGFAATFSLLNSGYGAELAILWQASFILASQVGIVFFLLEIRKKQRIDWKLGQNSL
jgi:uncharacterized membrane protein YbhN (UPF0104 family)